MVLVRLLMVCDVMTCEIYLCLQVDAGFQLK